MPVNIHRDRILIIDFGSQYTQLIARRVRNLGVYCEIYPYDVDIANIKQFAPSGIILSGGPETTIDEATAPKAPLLVFELGCPVLGICYGMQTMAAQLGGQVQAAHKREFGYARVQVNGDCVLLANIQDAVNHKEEAVLEVWMSHGDHVLTVPEGFIAIASTDNAPIVAMAHTSHPFYGLQFHPEVTHTKQGAAILGRFVHDICGCGSNWTPGNIIEDAVRHVRETVGKDQVLLGLSGGVDSSVVAMLLHKAIGDQLTCVFVDNGLLRQNEADEVLQLFSEQRHIRIIVVDARDRFYHALAGVSDPEEKRKIIGNVFVDVFEEKAREFKEMKWLAQGTIYPDVIESAGSKTGKAHVIKTHHNVGGLPSTMSLKLIEPLRELFKDEVRELGLALGLPSQMIQRHPFPGPGLGVRILGEIKSAYIDILRQADAIFIQSLYDWDLYHKVSQAFAVFLPVKSVGVVGDARQYEYVIALRAVETIDFMTAHWAKLPHDFLAQVADRILNEVKGVARVTYDISGKPPATIEWE